MSKSNEVASPASGPPGPRDTRQTNNNNKNNKDNRRRGGKNNGGVADLADALRDAMSKISGDADAKRQIAQENKVHTHKQLIEEAVDEAQYINATESSSFSCRLNSSSFHNDLDDFYPCQSNKNGLGFVYNIFMRPRTWGQRLQAFKTWFTGTDNKYYPDSKVSEIKVCSLPALPLVATGKLGWGIASIPGCLYKGLQTLFLSCVLPKLVGLLFALKWALTEKFLYQQPVSLRLFRHAVSDATPELSPLTKVLLGVSLAFSIYPVAKAVKQVVDYCSTERRELVLIPTLEQQVVVEQVASFNTETVPVTQMIVHCQPAVKTTFLDGSTRYCFDDTEDMTLQNFCDREADSQRFRTFYINFRQIPELINQKTLLALRTESDKLVELNRLKRFMESDSKHSDSYLSLLSGRNVAVDTYTFSMCRITNRPDPHSLLQQAF